MLTYNQKAFIYWIQERESIRLKKEAGLPAPWTGNKVMQETYFCNVNRENDKVTKWIRENWHYPLSPRLYDVAMFVARVFNKPSTLERISQPLGDFDSWLWNAEGVLRTIRGEGNTIWSGAYMISTNGRKIDKIDHCIEMFENLADNPEITKGCTTLLEAHKALMKVYGLSSFLAAQIVADLKNSSGHPLQNAPDWFTFSAYGPGSLRGLGWFWDKAVKPKDYQEAIDEAYDLIELELPSEIIDNLHHQDLQNCFCEYDKFMRVTNGTGRSKRKYTRGSK